MVAAAAAEGLVFARMSDLIDPVLDASDGAEASRLFFDAARSRGATYLQTRVYRRPEAPLTSERHFAAGGLVSRFARPGWAGSAAFNYICFDCNPPLDAIRTSRTRYRFGDFADHRDRAFGDYWTAFSEAGIAEMICATAYGSDRTIASLHLGFDDRETADAEASAVQMAGQILVERLMALSEPADDTTPRLTPRERDCLTFVAEGKSDWEISVILSVSESTARFHIDNARRKLGAVTRAQAVARLAVVYGL